MRIGVLAGVTALAAVLGVGIFAAGVAVGYLQACIDLERRDPAVLYWDDWLATPSPTRPAP
jgi:hypothetical protein